MTAEVTVTQIGPNQYSVFIPLKLKKRGGRKMIYVPDGQELYESQNNHDPALVKAVVRVHLWQRQMKQGKKYSTMQDLAKANKLSIQHIRRLMQLAFLAPSIKEAILNGTQPRQLKLQDLIEDVPMLWYEQEARWGFKPTYPVPNS